MEDIQATLPFGFTDTQSAEVEVEVEVLSSPDKDKKGPHDHAASYGLPNINEDAVDTNVYDILATVPIATTRGNIIEHLNRAMTFTSAGIPEAIIRPDRIPPNMSAYPLEKRYHIWQASLESLSFSQGFPAWHESGAPLWEACPFEDKRHFKLFEVYRQLIEDHDLPVRELHQMPKHLVLKQADDPDIKDFMSNYNSEMLFDLYQCYSWSIRCHAFDLYSKTKEVKRHALNAQTFLTKQQQNAASLLEKLMTYFNQTEYDDVTETEVPIWQIGMKGTDAFNALKTIHTISKDVLGIANPSTSSPGGVGNPLGQLPLNASIETLMASIAIQGDMTKHPQYQGVNQEGKEKKGLRDENSMDIIRRMLSNKNQARAVQNAMLMLTKPDETETMNILKEEKQRTGEYDEEGKLVNVGADQR